MDHTFFTVLYAMLKCILTAAVNAFHCIFGILCGIRHYAWNSLTFKTPSLPGFPVANLYVFKIWHDVGFAPCAFRTQCKRIGGVLCDRWVRNKHETRVLPTVADVSVTSKSGI